MCNESASLSIQFLFCFMVKVANLPGLVTIVLPVFPVLEPALPSEPVAPGGRILQVGDEEAVLELEHGTLQHRCQSAVYWFKR